MAWPGTAELTLAVLTMVRPGVRTGTLEVQGAAAGQLLPGAAELVTWVMRWLPVSGLLTVIVPVIVTVPPAGMSPVHTAPVVPIDRMPELVVWSPLPTASSAMPDPSKLTEIPKYGVAPVLVKVVVPRSTAPGVVDAELQVVTIASWDTVTVAVHPGPGLAAGQLLPEDGELIVLVRILFPVSGLFTVTV